MRTWDQVIGRKDVEVHDGNISQVEDVCVTSQPSIDLADYLIYDGCACLFICSIAAGKLFIIGQNGYCGFPSFVDVQIDGDAGQLVRLSGAMFYSKIMDDCV